MSTGYICSIVDGEGISFKDFVLKCARAFGATIDMRDEPIDKPIPDEFKASTSYHDKMLSKAKKELARLKAMSIEEAEAGAMEEYKVMVAEEKRSIKCDAEQRDKYNAMLKQVKDWEPPSRDHDNLKKFMITQITESIEFDCPVNRGREEVRKLSGRDWLKKQIDKQLWDIKYAEQHITEENERARRNSEWVRALRVSLQDKKKDSK
jgi:hypothetical protein